MGMRFYPATNQIIITRGDSGSKQILVRMDGDPLLMSPGDKIDFGVKKNYADNQCLIKKTYTENPFILTFDPEDTKSLPFGDYVWDMQYVAANGYTDTFVAKKTFTITEEVVD